MLSALSDIHVFSIYFFTVRWVSWLLINSSLMNARLVSAWMKSGSDILPQWNSDLRKTIKIVIYQFLGILLSSWVYTPAGFFGLFKHWEKCHSLENSALRKKRLWWEKFIYRKGQTRMLLLHFAKKTSSGIRLLLGWCQGTIGRFFFYFLWCSTELNLNLTNGFHVLLFHIITIS